MKRILTTALALLSFSAMADDAQIKAKLTSMGLKNVELQDSQIKGLRTVISEDEGVFYITEDGKYALYGKLYELKDNMAVEISGKALLEKMNALKNEMIVYPAKNEKHVVTVFMDTTCHYCHILIDEIPQYNELGITLRFLAFPRMGLESDTAKQMEAIWTAKDPVFALNEAQKGVLPKNLKTPNIVKKHYELGKLFKISGTPSIITSTGQVIGGYLKPKTLLATLEE